MQHSTYFHWQGLQLVGEHRDTNKECPSYYFYQASSYTPLARIECRSEQSEIYYYHAEENGMPVMMTDERGKACWKQEKSTIWGRIKEEHKTTNLAYVDQNLRFAGQYYDSETGLHYNTFRYYDPEAGRFTQPDPIGLAGGLNLYSYAPNPLSWIDPLGLHVSHGIDVLADDWWVKGAHAHIDKIEIAIKPGNNGEIIYKSVFSKTNTESVAWNKATSKLDDYLSNSKNKSKVINYLEKAKARWPDKAAEWSHLQKNLQKTDNIKGRTGKIKGGRC